MAVNDFFVWGKGGQKMTPEQIEREREIAAALTKQGADFSPVGHWTQGAARMANALVGNIREGRADRAQQEGITGANEAFSNANIAQYLSPAAGNSYPAAVAAGASPTSAIATNTQLPAEAGAIRQGLMDRGLPEHVADGFVMNFQDESGFNPGINEAKPLVAGSRGGYGLYQLTGPRRREYEAFAQQRGVSPDSVDAQLDFLVGELGGKESAAAQKIMNTSNAGEAGAAIVNSFLRPSPEHRTSRANKYLNSGGVQVASADPNFMPEQAYAPVADALNSPQQAIAAVSPQSVAQQQPAQAPDPVAEALLAQNDMALGGALAPQGTVAPQQMAGDFPPAPSMVSGKPQGEGYPGEVRQGADGKNYQYAQTSGMMGAQGGQGWIETSMSPQGQQQTVNQPNLQGLIEVINNPFANQSQKAMAQMAMQQVMQNNDPMRALEMQQAQQGLTKGELEIAAMQQPKAQEYGFQTLGDGTVVRTNKLTGEVMPAYEGALKPTVTMQELEAAGFVPGTPEYQQAIRDSQRRGTSVTTNVGGEKEDAKFWEGMGAAQAKTFSDMMDSGNVARRNKVNIDRLSQLAATTPQGMQGAVVNTLANAGIKLEGASNIEAMESLISNLVPSQRPPGSGTISDADLALYKASLPRVINSEKGNQLILETLKAINSHDIQAAEIADRVANRELTPAQARTALRSIPNPFDDWEEKLKSAGATDADKSGTNGGWKEIGGVKIRKKQ